MADFWDKQHALGYIKRSDKMQIVVNAVEKEGKKYVDVRNYYRNKDGDWTPGKGISVPGDHMEQLIKILSTKQ